MKSCEINQKSAKMGSAGWIIFPDPEDEFDQKIRRINERIDKSIKEGCIKARKPQSTTIFTSSPGSWSDREVTLKPLQNEKTE